MTATVLLFASIAEKAGVRKIDVELQPGATVATVRQQVIERFPQLRDFVPTLLYALDEEYVRDSATVRDGATVAFIPPVSGG